MLLRAHLPEKYGPARRGNTPRDSHSDHDDDPKPETSQDDRESLDDIRQDLQQLKQFAGLTDPDTVPLSNTPNLSPAGEDTSQSNLSATGGEIQRGGSSPTEEDTSQSNLSPAGGEIQRGGSPAATTDRHTGEGSSPTSSHPSAPSTSSPSPVVGENMPRTRYGGWGEGDLPHPQHPEPNTRNLSRRQRRQLQRKQRKQRKHLPYPDARTKQPNSHRPRAPN